MSSLLPLFTGEGKETSPRLPFVDRRRLQKAVFALGLFAIVGWLVHVSVSLKTTTAEVLEIIIEQRSSAASDRWAPVILDKSLPSIPLHFAPGIAASMGPPDRVYGEELLYPDFEIPAPIFANVKHQEIWKKEAASLAERATPLNDGYHRYKGQHGQNFILRNITFRPPVSYDHWGPLSCMNPGTTLQGLDIALRNASDADPVDVADALLAHSPDSWSFQHYLDRVTHIVGQAAHLTPAANLTAITGREGNAMVNQLWKANGFEEDHVMHAPGDEITIGSLFFACKAPLIHPYLSLKSAERMGVPWIQPDFQDSPDRRKKIMYMSRTHGHTSNGGRRVINEADLLAAIRQTLIERDLGETLVEFVAEDYANTTALWEFMSTEVLAVIGPHGGAIMNHRWAPPKTLVIELFPSNFMNFAHWEEANMLNQTYAAIVVDPVTWTDMEIDPRCDPVVAGQSGKAQYGRIAKFVSVGNGMTICRSHWYRSFILAR